MISLFATGDFVRCSIRNPALWGIRVGMVMGMVRAADGALECIINGPDGEIVLIDARYVITDFVYDASRDRFTDRSAEEAEPEE